MNIIGYLWCAFGLISLITTSEGTRPQNEQNDLQLYDMLTTDDSTRIKKPFCNAFTGCGKKRSFYSDKSMDNEERSTGKIRIPVPIYRALLRAASRDVRQMMMQRSAMSGKGSSSDEYTQSGLNNQIPSLHSRYQS